MIITLENDQDKLQISEELEQLLTAGLNVVARLHSLSERTEVDITIVDDEEIHMLNRDYRNVDRPTDVLSFALDEESEEEPELLGGPEEHLLGDIIISAETASRQAEEFGHGLEREIVYLAVHGLLHLLGSLQVVPEAVLGSLVLQLSGLRAGAVHVQRGGELLQLGPQVPEPLLIFVVFDQSHVLSPLPQISLAIVLYRRNVCL